MTENTEPPLDELADEQDELDWNVNEHGRMKEHVEEPPETVLWMSEE